LADVSDNVLKNNTSGILRSEYREDGSGWQRNG
jgi:hypothetical protein